MPVQVPVAMPSVASVKPCQVIEKRRRYLPIQVVERRARLAPSVSGLTITGLEKIPDP
jgi:hypothetical protein